MLMMFVIMILISVCNGVGQDAGATSIASHHSLDRSQRHHAKTEESDRPLTYTPWDGVSQGAT
jgi:hypothetical protein